MTAVSYIGAALVIIAVAFVFLRIFDAWDARRVAAGIRKIGVSVCTRCGKTIGEEAASTASRAMIKYVVAKDWRRRGRDYPTQLLIVACPHCSAELQFRMNGTFLSYLPSYLAR